MAANNTVVLIGRAGRVPEMRYLESGKVVTKFSLAVDRPIKDKQGNKITDWFNVEFWGKKAELAGELIKKGSLISVNGAIQIEEWTDKEGAKRTTVQIKADDFHLLESKAAAALHESNSMDSDAPMSAPREPVAAKASRTAPIAAASSDEEFEEIPF